jgi:3-deoxy-D-manno-octulosonic-acid transferase
MPRASTGAIFGAALALYRGGGRLLAPVARAYIRRRARAGKEDPLRLEERFGFPSAPRPPGRLIWCHAASVGEALSLLPLLHRLLAERPDFSAVLTTGTTTSAEVVAPRLPPRARHQFAPIDVPAAFERFLAHWRPDAVLWAESEFWPGMIAAVAARGVPLVLVNGRVSAKSHARWLRARPVIGGVLDCFSLCLAQSDGDASNLTALGARTVRAVGNLKFAAPPLTAAADALAALRAQLGQRPRWLAASVHPGEDDIALTVHRRLKARDARVLTVVVPRHARRGPAIAERFRAEGHIVSLRSAGEAPSDATEIYVADTMGEMGLWFRLAPVAFIGGSLVAHGGQNPLEAARLDCAILYGPHMENFAEVVAVLEQSGGAARVADGPHLAREVERLLFDDAAAAKRMAAAAAALANRAGGVLDRVIGEIAPLLDNLPGG